MHARVTRIEASPARLDEMTRQFEARTVPVIEGLEGYKPPRKGAVSLRFAKVAFPTDERLARGASPS